MAIEDLINLFDESNTKRLLNVGDQVAISSNYGLHDMTKVNRITKTLAILDNRVTLKREIHSNGYIAKHSTHLDLNRYTLATPEDFKAYNKLLTYRAFKSNINSLSTFSEKKIIQCTQESLDQLLNSTKNILTELNTLNKS